MKDRKTIAVLGANGRLSYEIMLAFLQANYQVIAVTRNGALRNAPEGVELRAADALNAQQLLTATNGADFIFNGLNPPYTAWHKQALPMARNVITAARHHGAIHLFPGNIYNYGRTIPAICDEQTAFQASDRKGKIRIEMEQLFAEAAQQSTKTAIIRAGDFFGGSGTGSWFDLALVSKLDKGKFTYPGNPDIAHAWAYLPDLAQAFVAIAQRHQQLAAFETFVFAGHTLTGAQIKQQLERITGKTLKQSALPWPLLKILGWFMPMMREITEVSYLWFCPHQLDDKHLQTFIAHTIHHTPTHSALSEALISKNI